jgi:hypothetical protein
VLQRAPVSYKYGQVEERANSGRESDRLSRGRGNQLSAASGDYAQNATSETRRARSVPRSIGMNQCWKVRLGARLAIQ